MPESAPSMEGLALMDVARAAARKECKVDSIGSAGLRKLADGNRMRAEELCGVPQSDRIVARQDVGAPARFDAMPGGVDYRDFR